MKRPLAKRVKHNFWWVRHDVLEYKMPIAEGATLLPSQYLVPGFVPDTRELRYKFVHGRKDNRKIGDFSEKFISAFFVNEKAYAAFEDMFSKHGRAYAVRCSNEKHYIVLIDKVHDAVDLKRSKYERSDIETRVEDDISRFHRVALRKDFSTQDDIFRLDGSFQLNNILIVSDRFRERYDSSGLTGLYFKPTDGSK
jgi:hypothetical protein